MNIDRLPPNSPEAEQGILGCILLSPNECLDECVVKIRNLVVFYDIRHQTIWNALVQMHQSGNKIDVITLQQQLKDSKQLDQVGGIAYLSSLPDTVPSAANLSYYLDIAFEKYLLRSLIHACTDAVGRVYSFSGPVSELLDSIERQILAVAEARSEAAIKPTMKELVCEAISQIERLHALQGAISGISTGFPDLDRHTDGLHPGEMTVIAAYPGGGKTALAINIAERTALDQNLPVGIFSLEMTGRSLVVRTLCSRARVNLRGISGGLMTEGDFPKLSNAAGKLAKAPIFLDDSSDLTILELRSRARRMWQKHDIKLLVVDYLQLLTAGKENRQEDVAAVSSGIKALANELNVPVLALSQLNDDGKLRESRAIGQDADAIWMLEKKNETPEADQVDLWIRKQRNGPAGVCVPLVFLKRFTRFESVSRVQT